MKLITGFLRSMSGRIFVMLLVGVAVSASLATALVDARRRAELERSHLERAADRIHAYAVSPSAESQTDMVRIRPARPGVIGGPGDEVLTRLLAERFGPKVSVIAVKSPLSECQGLSAPPQRPSARMSPRLCWLVSVNGPRGAVQLTVDRPARPVRVNSASDPLFQISLALAALILAFFVARMAAAPLKGLAEAARNLGRDLDHPPLSEKGPSEVAAAAAAFNAMQARLRRDLTERRHMLAAITHDLQTPLTRLRLRLEGVKDRELRARLVDDLAAMQVLIREGLDLARSADWSEPWAVLDLDSLLESLVEDEVDAGRPATFGSPSRADVRVRPLALRRALANLIDNAIRYGGSVEVSAEQAGADAVIYVRDAGPGVSEELLESIFEPFARLETSRSRETGGSGLGLAIARTLVERSGGALSLANRPTGGLEARIVLPAQA